MLSMLRMAAENIRAIRRNSYMPFERQVCLESWSLRTALVVGFALGAWHVAAWLPWYVAAYLAWGAGWCGGFVWADFGLGQWYAKKRLGYSYNPNVINTTLEGYEGPKENYENLVKVWQLRKRDVLRPWDGDPPGGKFGGE